MCEQKLSVFSADYWRAARRELNNPRVLAFSGLVCAMAIVLESLPIYLLGPRPENLLQLPRRLAGLYVLRPRRRHDGRGYH